MSFTRTCRIGISSLVALAFASLSPAPAHAQDAPGEAPAVTVSAGIDFVNQYMFRGIRQNSTGIATWPWVDLGISAFEGEGGLKSVGINVGTWNSAHSKGGGWYESDVYVTLGLGFGAASLDSTYTSYTSPNDSFTHVKEIAFKLGIDDSPALGAAALSPYVLLALEMGAEPGRYQADGGLKGGRYLELGVAPEVAGARASLAVPVKLGLSAGNYYELDGTDHAFGFFSVGGIVTVPVGSNFDVHGGVEVQKLGTTTKALNDGEGSQVIGSFGIGVSF